MANHGVRTWRTPLALFGVIALLYIPFAGNYGLWDPWETHYGEVARQMAERGDAVSLWWPGSPDEHAEFWSKPVLTFWLMALSLRAFGLESAHAAPSEMADSWRAEWALRTPGLLLSLAAIWATWELGRRLAGRRAGALAALVLATSSQWILVSRQAMTDLVFVSPMTLALALAGLALLLPAEETERELPRARFGRMSWPHAPAFYGFVALALLCALPEILVIAAQVRLPFTVGERHLRLAGIVPMVPYLLALALALVLCARARSKRQLYLFSAWVLAGVATLGKGPAGIGLPALVIAAYLVASGRAREIVTRLELPRGALLFVAVAFPWYHAMLIRHGMGFWNEFIGDNYIHRATGRHGDRGAFDYYLAQIGHGMFPWSGIVAAAGLRSLSPPTGDEPRRALARYALTWFLVEWAVVTLVQTKFHHYILPALPALALLAGLLLDDLVSSVERRPPFALLLVALPVTLACGRDLAALPARLLWLFNYDYVVAPNGGRPWPSQAIYGNRYEYGITIALFTALATALVALLWLKRKRVSQIALATLLATSLVWSAFLVDKFLIDLSPHWSQKQPIAAYYAHRAGPDEPLIAWQLKWRGENFYTRNAIYRDDKTIVLFDHSSDRLQEILAAHPHRRLFFLLERGRLESLRAQLPPSLRDSLTVVDESNNKLYLAVVTPT